MVIQICNTISFQVFFLCLVNITWPTQEQIGLLADIKAVLVKIDGPITKSAQALEATIPSMFANLETVLSNLAKLRKENNRLVFNFFSCKKCAILKI